MRTLERLAQPVTTYLDTSGTSRRQFAEHLGIGTSRLWWLESAAGNPTLRTTVAIGRKLGLQLAYKKGEIPKRRTRPAGRAMTLQPKRKDYSRTRRHDQYRRQRDPVFRAALRTLRLLGVVLRRRRIALRLSASELARLAGVPALQVWKIEGGIGNPTIRTLARIGEVSGLSLHWARHHQWLNAAT